MRHGQVTRHGVLPKRIATLSVHTSPLDQPGAGDAGGMNVYVLETARRLAASGVEVEIFTRAVSSDLPRSVQVEPGVLVRHITAGPYEGLSKNDLPGQLCAFTAAVLRTEAQHEEGWYDLVHSHYWLSGQVGWLARDRWRVPLVHTAHTLAKAKNAAMAAGDCPEPPARIIGEQQVIDEADRIVANTADEAEQLQRWYDADPAKVVTVPPGVDLGTFCPMDRAAARAAIGVPADALVLLFVGRLQPLKAPDVLLRTAAELVRRDPQAAQRLQVLVVGAPSGNGLAEPSAYPDLARALGIADRVRFCPPASRAELARYYNAADLTVVPSHNESFGLVALESQACGTPVVAARVGGLPTAVPAGRTGLLVAGHRIADWADALHSLLHDPGRRAAFARQARSHAEQFSWRHTADGLLAVYRDALADTRALVRAQ
ncbi:MAG TPA: D-inositol-3-phosphate glycosyltransferase [Jatrophihabitans sp.]|nr:D-inositol-3-phosphate glycosyltransferase [Jatrophihabitans sp.]